MVDYQITGIIRDIKGQLVKVYTDGGVFSVEDIYYWIESGRYRFFTFKNDGKAIVHIGETPSGRKYITTHPDGVTENNLDELKPLNISQVLKH